MPPFCACLLGATPAFMAATPGLQAQERGPGERPGLMLASRWLPAAGYGAFHASPPAAHTVHLQCAVAGVRTRESSTRPATGSCTFKHATLNASESMTCRHHSLSPARCGSSCYSSTAALRPQSNRLLPSILVPPGSESPDAVAGVKPLHEHREQCLRASVFM